MVEDWKNVNSFKFPLQKLGVKTKVLSQNKQCPVFFNTSESGVPSILSQDVSQYKKLCAIYVQHSHTLLWLAILKVNAMITTVRFIEEHTQEEIWGLVAF